MCTGNSIVAMVLVLIIGITIIILFTAAELKKEKSKRRIWKIILIDIIIAILTLNLLTFFINLC